MKDKESGVLKRRSIVILALVMLMAAIGMTGIYVANKEKKQEEQLAQKAQEKKAQLAAKANEQKKSEEKTSVKITEDREDWQKELAMEQANIMEQQQELKRDLDADPLEENLSVAESTEEPTAVEAGSGNVSELHFDQEQGICLPIQGDVIMGYSMDRTIYFPTLDQYKYNPAMVISAEVNDKVTSAALGRVSDISTNEETGCTVTVDLGDGYSAVYGQLKEVPCQVGELVAQGSTIGYVSEPTKYFSTEGTNLYFQMKKDGEPVDPIDFLPEVAE